MKAWSRGTNSRLPFAINAMLNLSIDPLKDIVIVSIFQTLWSQNLSPNYHLIVCLAILDKHRRIIMENELGFTEILKVCRTP